MNENLLKGVLVVTTIALVCGATVVSEESKNNTAEAKEVVKKEKQNKKTQQSIIRDTEVFQIKPLDKEAEAVFNEEKEVFLEEITTTNNISFVIENKNSLTYVIEDRNTINNYYKVVWSYVPGGKYKPTTVVYPLNITNIDIYKSNVYDNIKVLNKK